MRIPTTIIDIFILPIQILPTYGYTVFIPTNTVHVVKNNEVSHMLATRYWL